ncbi:MAG: hypothetical protein IJI37_02730, partial [Opitutales bacterium]|nr:hypothetical protein [Opitutales bacterium]
FMTVPLVVLGLYSVAGGWCFEGGFSWAGGAMDCLLPASAASFVKGWLASHEAAVAAPAWFGIAATASTFAALAAAYLVYGRTPGRDPVRENLPLLYSELNRHGRFDELYGWYVAKVQQRFATLLATFFDLLLIELLSVRGVAIVCAVIGQGFKRLHDASANSEVKWIVAGFVILFALIFA